MPFIVTQISKIRDGKDLVIYLIFTLLVKNCSLNYIS